MRRALRMLRSMGSLVVVTVLVTGSAVHAASPGPNGLPVPPDAAPGGPSLALGTLDQGVRKAYSGVGLLDYASTCTAVLIRPAPGEPPAGAPAYALTNGHCVDLFDATSVLRDVPVPTDMPGLTFGAVVAGDPGTGVPLRAIRWATMKGTDLAIIELDATLPDLLAQGLRAYPMAPPVADGTPVVVVGGPASTDGTDRVLRLAACTAGSSVDLLERHWTWFGFPANDCADIRPGSSGSPVFDPGTGSLVGLVSTTTQGSEGISDCSMGRPCEVGPDGVASVGGMSYGPPVTPFLDGCFDATWTFTGPGDACALDPGDGLGVTDWTISANPGAHTITSDVPSPSTWGVTLVPGSPDQAWMRIAEGPAGAVDCHDPAVYGPPMAIPGDLLYDPPLPTADGSHVMCLLGGTAADASAAWQSPAFPTVLRVDIDRTPPISPVELSVRDLPDAWSVEPIYRSPELSLFEWKWGPPAMTDCADPTGYAIYRRFPTDLPHADAPTRMCVIGYDDANNASPALDRVFSLP